MQKAGTDQKTGLKWGLFLVHQNVFPYASRDPYYWVLKGSRALTIRSLEA